jgi:hypothetical protein
VYDRRRLACRAVEHGPTTRHGASDGGATNPAVGALVAVQRLGSLGAPPGALDGHDAIVLGPAPQQLLGQPPNALQISGGSAAARCLTFRHLDAPTDGASAWIWESVPDSESRDGFASPPPVPNGGIDPMTIPTRAAAVRSARFACFLTDSASVRLVRLMRKRYTGVSGIGLLV